jgi:aminoglycoside phosphotransferase (APT) family kinase protein
MPNDPTLDPLAILAELGIAEVQSAAPVSGGEATSIWRVEHDGLVSALRVFGPGQAPAAARERAAMVDAAGGGIRVPDIRAAGLWRDRPAMLLSWCDGQALAAALQTRPWLLLGQGRAFGRMQARIHTVRASAAVESHSADWVDWYGAADVELQAALRRLAGARRQLLHLDYHPLNVLMQGSTVSAVLDWANARAGDPRADVARTYTILMVAPHGARRDSPLYMALRYLLTRAWLAGYRSVAGPLHDMPAFFAWAGSVMQADLAPRVGDPQHWLRPEHMGRVEHWRQRWRTQVG